MHRRFAYGCAALALGVVLYGAASVATAGTRPTGTPIDIVPMQDLTATIDRESRSGLAVAIATILGFVGIGGFVTGHPVAGFAGVGSGLGMGFVPGMTSASFSSAPAATGSALAAIPIETWWTPVLGLLYLPMLMLKLLQDPVVLSLAIVVLYSLRILEHRRTPFAIQEV